MCHPWRHSRSTWMGLRATCFSCRCSCWVQGNWNRWPLRVPSKLKHHMEAASACTGGEVLQVEILHVTAAEPQQHRIIEGLRSEGTLKDHCAPFLWWGSKHPAWNWWFSCPWSLEMNSKCQSAGHAHCQWQSIPWRTHRLHREECRRHAEWNALPEVMQQSATEPGIDQGFLALPLRHTKSFLTILCTLLHTVPNLSCPFWSTTCSQIPLRKPLLSTLSFLTSPCSSYCSDCKFLDIRTSCNWESYT